MIARNISLLSIAAGIILLLLASRPLQLSIPHFYAIGLAIAAIGLHTYEEFLKVNDFYCLVDYEDWKAAKDRTLTNR